MAARAVVLMLYEMPDHQGGVLQLAKQMSELLQVDLDQEMVLFVYHILLKCMAAKSVISPALCVYKANISELEAAKLLEEHTNDGPPEYA